MWHHKYLGKLSENYLFIYFHILSNLFGGTIDSKNNQLSRGAILNILCYILTWVPNQPINQHILNSPISTYILMVAEALWEM